MNTCTAAEARHAPAARVRQRPGPADQRDGRTREPIALTITATSQRERRPIIMLWIIVMALIAIVALIVLSFILHFLLSPWLLVAIGILILLRFRPRRSRR
jgi:fatty acid desaturase